MKNHPLLAALLLALPAVSHADHRDYSGHRGNLVVPAVRSYSPGYCAPRQYGYPGYGSTYSRPGYFGLGFSFFSRPVPAPTYYDSASRYGDDAALESSVQRALKRQGYYRGSVDGDIGPESRAAIREYQANHGLARTGRIDGSLLRSLGL